MDPWAGAQLHYADGRVKWFGPEEREASDVAGSMQTATKIPGGYDTGSLVLARPPDLSADEAALFSHVEFQGAEGTFYEGRVSGVPQVEVNAIRLEFEGWAAALEDNEALRFLGVDSDLSHWTLQPSAARSLKLNPSSGAAFRVSGSTEVKYAEAGDAEEMVLQRFTSVENIDGPTVDMYDLAEAWYDAHGLNIGAVYHDTSSYDWNSGNAPIGLGGAWVIQLLLSLDDAHSSFDARNCITTQSGYFLSTASRKWATLQTYFGNFIAQVNGDWQARWKKLRAYGDHGLPRRGSDPSGLWLSDVLAYLLPKYAPALSFSDSIEASGVTLPQVAYFDPTTLRKLIEDLTPFGGALGLPNDWGVYDGRQFFHRSPGTYGRLWKVSEEDVATETEEGPDAQARCAGLVVSFQTPSGRTRYLGPPGSGADLETAELADSSSGIPAEKIKHRNLGLILDDTGALAAGKLLLAEANETNWRGKIKAQGEARDESGNKWPVRQMRAGDRVFVESESNPTVRTIASTSYDQDSLTNEVDIGAPPLRSDVLLAQLAAQIDLVAT